MPYWLNPKISFKIFKLLNKKLYPKPDIVPKEADRVLWQLLRERKINIIISDSERDREDPIQISTKAIPKNCKMIT